MSEDKEGKPIKLKLIEKSEFLEEMTVQMDSNFPEAKEESLQKSQETATLSSSRYPFFSNLQSFTTFLKPSKNCALIY